jgi:S1-C subfamily serine protease
MKRHRYTRRTLSVVGTLFCLAVASPGFSQAQPATVAVTAVLIDSELNTRPVPKHALLLKCGDQTPVRAVTGFDGKAEISATAGDCTLESERPIDFQQHSYRWAVKVTAKAGERTNVDLSNENAITAAAATSTSTTPDFPRLFREWQGSVVTVWSESGHGTGFLIDDAGIFLTNEHVVHGSGYLAVQFDDRTKVRADLLAANPERDVALIRVSPAVLKDTKPVKLATAADLDRPREGEAVFTIGSPLNQKKVMTTGIISKVEKRAIISDVNINHGNSGGPLFDADGKVLGITTFGDPATQGGPGISGVVRIDVATETVATAKAAVASSPAPTADLLPVEPAEAYPPAAMRKALEGRSFKSFEDDQYAFGVGDFNVLFQTPVLSAGMAAIQEQELHKEQAKRQKKAGQAASPNPAFAQMRDWAEYVGQNVPVFVVRAAPKLKEGFWSGMARGLAASQGYYGGPAKLKFTTDFVSMKLFCGTKEAQPIQPNRVEVARDVQNYRVSVRDAAYYGFYTYPHDAIGPQCGQVRLEISSLKKKEAPEVKVVPQKVVDRIWNDFGPYRDALSGQGETAK